MDRKRFEASVVAVVEEGGESRRIPSTRPLASLRTFASLQLAQMVDFFTGHQGRKKSLKNSKFEARNPKQIQMTKIQNSKPATKNEEKSAGEKYRGEFASYKLWGIKIGGCPEWRKFIFN